jgi:signal transduction histidine kinase
VASLRSLLVDIYPARLADAGLAAAITDLARPLEGRGVAVEVDVDDAAVARLGRTEQQVVHRVTRECLRNVVKHAEATHVVVRLTLGEPGETGETGEPGETGESALDADDRGQPVVLSVDDDGVGFDPATLPSREGHFGVRVLADLATDVSAVLRVSSSPGGGTRWRLVMPAGERA